MVKIRLLRTGRTNQPAYRVVVVDGRKRRDGSTIEIIGHYSPLGKQEVQLDKARYDYWVQQGAQPSVRVAKLATKAS